MNRIVDLLIRIERRVYITIKRIRLRNKNFTIISSNCNGAFILHDLGQPFNSPTVDLFIKAKDFLKLNKNLKYYMNIEPVEVHENGVSFPVGMIGDIKIYFMHYQTFEQARGKWMERVRRINYNNIFILMTDKDGCTYEDLCEFEQLPYDHKIVLTHKSYAELKSTYKIAGFEKDTEVGILSDWKPGFFRRRWLDDFDYVSFLNGKEI